MVRTTVCSLAGAAAGFVLAIILVAIIDSGSDRGVASDTIPVTIFLGSLLAIGGAIAGAVIGGAAEVVKYLRRRDTELNRSDQQ